MWDSAVPALPLPNTELLSSLHLLPCLVSSTACAGWDLAFRQRRAEKQIMTSETGSESDSKKDQEKDQQNPAQKGVSGTQQGQQDGEDHENLLENIPAAAAHSTPLKAEKNADKDWDKEAATKPLKYQQLEDDKVSQKSGSSKVSKSPLKAAKVSKNMQAKVKVLDGSEYTCEVEKRSKGQVLFNKVCEHLNLLEKDYFGLTYSDSENQKNWLDPSKEIKKQTRNGAWHFSFNVKFYPPDPSQLSEDITRYYLCLQLRDDIVCGRLPCSFVTLALLGSYSVQSELGDYDPEEYGSEYANEFRFAPNQTKELEDKVVELHKSYRGMTPAEAEMHFLENAKKLSMYGVDLHHAKDSEGVEIMLGVCASGLLIYRDRLRINRFAWPKVLKISYKRNNFYIKIRPGEFEQFESTIGFKLPNHRAAKRLWKVCVEHHTFFRLLMPEAPPKKFLTLGSKFRYSGRTQAQSRRASALIDRPAPYFERSSSKRYTMSRSLDGEVGSGPYITAKGISQTNLITTVTPEKKAEEERDEEEEEKKKKVEIITTVTTFRHDTKTDSEQTDTAADGETTATESDQEEDTYAKTQEFDRNQEELMKHQTNISELKRTFLETSKDTTTGGEWEKRLSTSPVRLVMRHEEAPMIEPLVPEETKEEREKREIQMSLERTSYSMLESQPGDKLREARATSPVATSHQIFMQKTIPTSPETKQSSGEKTLEGSDIYSLLESTRKPSEFLGEVTSTSQSWAQRTETTTEWDSSRKGQEDIEQKTKEKVVQGIVGLEESQVRSVHASGDASELAVTVIASSLKGVEGSTLKKEPDEDLPVDTSAQEEQHGSKVHVSALLDGKPQVESPVVKTEIITFGSIADEEKLDVSTKDAPVVHTETKTITYESSEQGSRTDTDAGVLMSAQTITSETFGTTTTTHITKTVKGGISETRIEKRIVITGDADIDHDQALAQAIKEAKEQHPDMSVTKVVVHKETEITPEDGEE
ncbi:band 4.1-like protein 3 isoform X17 [Xenopus laevis]|uniref:Band 4.1-like protein 3 isoform X17 n=1 Tax=Xenopus laevis TaxID=8355 RepID=A0A8J1L5A4_XENLA|nr:band 4.1-like protein 3 isoform X17 [Xenopus laevis]